MANSTKRPARRPKNAHRDDRLAGTPILRGVLPSALMYQLPHPSGVPANDPARRAQFHALNHAPALASIPRLELTALVGSAAKTYTRAAYHEARFHDLRGELDRRRQPMPGEIVWDSLLEYVHFELQAFAGACRTLLDELVYIVARRHGSSTTHARRAPWLTADLCQKPVPAQCDVPEVHAIRDLRSWFDTLNAYRNTFFHHGWRHGGGHFSNEDLRAATQVPSSNGLLVPDRKSLAGRSKPHEWTWVERTTVDEIAKVVRAGTEQLLDTMLGRIWLIAIPPPGSAPLAERPNMLVGLVRPAFIETERALILPIFSSRDRGLAFQPFASGAEIELVDAPASSVVIAQRAVSLSASGLEHNQLPPGVTHVEVVLDPSHEKGESGLQNVISRFEIQPFIAGGTINPISIVLPMLDRVWLWRPVEKRRNSL